MADLKKYQGLVEKKKWDKLTKNAGGPDAALIAEALGSSKAAEAYNLLVEMLSVSGRDVRLAIVKSLGKSGVASANSHINWLQQRTGEDDTEMLEAIHAAQVALRSK